MTEKRIDAIQIATNGLLEALDKTPRINWPQTLLMALTAVNSNGYAEGFRVAGLKTVPISASATGTGAAMPHDTGEDKALSNEPTVADELEDLGFQYIREIARQFGLMQIKPSDIVVDFEHNDDRSRLSFNIARKG